jgi:hypothetical protein
MVPTGAGIFSPHFLQRIVKSHCRLSGRLNTNVSIGEQKAKIQSNWPVDFGVLDCRELKPFFINQMT